LNNIIYLSFAFGPILYHQILSMCSLELVYGVIVSLLIDTIYPVYNLLRMFFFSKFSNTYTNTTCGFLLIYKRSCPQPEAENLESFY